ncbi:MAG: response regulator [Chloroflexi bacterium]|nr:response regulator [Chloroflexota bacterium]MBM3173095.1 response regulator [Chloroflexota bacterium]MBM3176249.1 response regulator [Chloroflexota bacterium]MBM4450084.1 response regulator [Chloroflexota bacterium]
MMVAKKVLVVSNDPGDLWTIGRAMVRHGFSVTAAASGNDGFRQLERNQPDYLIVDSAIQRGDLLALLAYSRRYFPETKIIMLTDHTPVTQKIEQLVGANHYLPKPVDPEIIHSIMSGTDISKSSAGLIH